MAACRTALYDWCAKEAHYTCACFSTSVFVTDDKQSVIQLPKKSSNKNHYYNSTT